MDAYNIPNASISILGKGVEKHYKKHHKLESKQDSKQDYTKHKKCSKTDNTVFDDLASHISLSAEQKDKITDLLNLFYYFIIYYSKNCFRKNADWDFKYKYKHHQKSNKLYRVGNTLLANTSVLGNTLLANTSVLGNTFDYDKANSLNAHGILLKIQKQLNHYRKHYPETKIFRDRFWTPNKISEITIFIDKSLEQMVNIIAVPLKLISPDITEKLNKYKYLGLKGGVGGVEGENKIHKKKSAFINYDILHQVLGNDLLGVNYS